MKTGKGGGRGWEGKGGGEGKGRRGGRGGNDREGDKEMGGKGRGVEEREGRGWKGKEKKQVTCTYYKKLHLKTHSHEG